MYILKKETSFFFSTMEQKLDTIKSGQSGNDNMIMGTNGLLYTMPQSLSTTVNRTFNREFSQRQSYSAGDTMVFDWNIGTSYPDPENTALCLDLTPKITDGAAAAGDRADFGTGTCANIIKEIQITSKNGVVIDKTQGAAVLAKIRKDYLYDSDGQKHLQMAGAGRVFGGATGLTGSKQRFVIPMSFISGFFRPIVKGMKIPSGLGAGLRIEIILNDASKVFRRTAGAYTELSYEVDNPQMLMMLHDLNDPTQAALMNESASSGLEYTFPSYFETTVSTSQTKVIEQVKMAVSQCTKVFATVYDLDGPNDITDIENDPLKSTDSDQLSELQFRVGGQYYPQQPLKNDIESWYVASSAFQKNKDSTSFPSSVSLVDYQTAGKFLMAHPLETDDKLNLSGVPLNNSNVLELRLTMATSVNREYHVVMEYVSVARTFVNKTSIKI
jgi:hypothetical protein